MAGVAAGDGASVFSAGVWAGRSAGLANVPALCCGVCCALARFSALLLGRSKDNNASCALGPFVRLFDAHFGIDDARTLEISLTVEGEDGFRMAGSSSLREISRDPLDLVAQTIGRNHQYPDGLALFTGTMFAPVEDRGAPGAGFTHKQGDIVTIAAPQLGALVNRVTTSDKAAPWAFGAGALMRNLAARKLI